MSKITELLDLIKKLPPGLTADWDGTNHYELTDPFASAGGRR